MTALERIGQDPAASAYGDLMRARRSGDDPYAREAGRVRILMASARSTVPPATPVPIVTPAQDVAAGEREVRRAIMQGFRL